jgi:hypothetical protein
MLNEFEDFGTNFKMHAMGQRFRAGHAKAQPIGDTMIKAVQGAIWEGWEMGLNKDEQSIYPTIPLLDGPGVEIEME